jgi:hypothetical protein
MQARSLTLAALASGFFFVGGRSTPPTVTKYRIRQISEQEVDLTSVGQPKQQRKAGSAMFVSIGLADSAAGRTVRFVVDSVVADSGTDPISQAQFDSLKGQSFQAFLLDGKVTAIKAAKEGQATSGISALISALNPRVKPGTKVGAAWTDTTDATNEIPSGSMTIRTVTNWKASGSEQHDGVATLKVDAASSSAVTGEQGGANFEGSGSGTATYYVGPDGRLVASNVSSTSTLAVSSPQAADPIPVTIKSTVAVTLVK